MRTSEKILLSFIAAGIIVLGSFVGFKYYEKSKISNPAAISQTTPSAPPPVSQTNALDVSGIPYYNSAPSSSTVQNLNSNANSSPTQTNSNTNSNTNAAAVPVPAAVPASPINSNSNSSTLEKASAPAPAPFSFAIIGDSQGFNPEDSNDSLKSAVANISKANPSLVMTEGDLISSCDGGSKCVQKYDAWKQVMQPLLDKTKEIQGNHDRVGKEAADQIWQNEFDLPTNGPAGYSELVYSFDFNNSHFVALDSEKPKEGLVDQDQRDWLEKDLAATQKENIFVFYHEPAYPVSSKIDESLDVHPADRDALWQILKNHRVTAVFSGHEHIMSRKNIDGLYQFVIGNTNSFDHDMPKAGMAEYAYQGHHYAIVSVSGKQVTVNVYKTDGSPLNSFVTPQ